MVFIIEWFDSKARSLVLCRPVLMIQNALRFQFICCLREAAKKVFFSGPATKRGGGEGPGHVQM